MTNEKGYACGVSGHLKDGKFVEEKGSRWSKWFDIFDYSKGDGFILKLFKKLRKKCNTT